MFRDMLADRQTELLFPQWRT